MKERQQIKSINGTESMKLNKTIIDKCVQAKEECTEIKKLKNTNTVISK